MCFTEILTGQFYIIIFLKLFVYLSQRLTLLYLHPNKNQSGRKLFLPTHKENYPFKNLLSIVLNITLIVDVLFFHQLRN